MAPGRVRLAAGLCAFLVAASCPGPAARRRPVAITDPQALFEMAEREREEQEEGEPLGDDALRWYRAAGGGGHLGAQLRLAEAYDEGDGVLKDRAEALRWYRRAAAQEDREAQYQVGRRAAEGEGASPDAEQALHWMERAARGGHAPAQFTLAGWLERGRFSPRDPVAATRWYRRAAEAGHAGARFVLGVRLAEGDGVAPDLADAYGWLLLAAGDGFEEARLALEILETRILHAEREQGRRLARETLGDVDPGEIELALGRRYLRGRGLPRAPERAVRWFRRAAERGNAQAQYELGLCLAQGLGVAPDPLAAHRWLSLAVARGVDHDRARRALADAEARLDPGQLAASRAQQRAWRNTLVGPGEDE